MKRPKVTTLIFGNPIVATALIAATGFMLYHWWTQTDTSSSVQPLLAGFVVWMVVTSSNRVAEYKSWERNWNAMESGNSLAEKKHSGSARLRVAIGVVFWVGWTYWLSEHRYMRGASDYDQLALGWLGVTALGVCYLMYRIARWTFGKVDQMKIANAQETAKQFVVKGALPKATASPNVREMADSLPESSRRLLKRLPGSAMQR